MKLPRFGVEEWLNVHEKEAVYDIAGVSIEALTLQELFELTRVSQEGFLIISENIDDNTQELELSMTWTNL
ncbi:transaminase [Streptococcus pasteurianus]|nr:transaminase [Streptococcus pasteurianus]